MQWFFGVEEGGWVGVRTHNHGANREMKYKKKRKKLIEGLFLPLYIPIHAEYSSLRAAKVKCSLVDNLLSARTPSTGVRAHTHQDVGEFAEEAKQKKKSD